MISLAPFLWFQDNAEQAAQFYLGIFPHARILDELRGADTGPWRAGAVGVLTLELAGQRVVLLNGGPGQKLTPAFSLVVYCDTQQEIDLYWDKLIDGGQPMACGWLTDRFGLSWQIAPRTITALVSHPAAMQAMMSMIKLDLATLEAAARQS